ncbi:class F sortase [Streptomyces sp. NBC_01762]|uniref:class F sortase n=1 Tax=unclassified Streptomyces TaxID=2593676 RepID=UPI002DDA71FE|nr:MULTISPECIES: class F sortase [unclassified Streptomyces]WSC48782.1 class F sortase [Streptomyces sp. NBC_01762]WSD28434.1 class F sortase [Streptomyces sp. NBC_01751]
MGRDHWRVERTGYSPWGALALVLLTALALVRNGPDPSPRPPRPVAAASAERHQDAPGAPPADVTVQPLAYAPASRVVIPAIRVDAPLIDVNLEPDGSIETPPPEDPRLAGWYRNGVAPGQLGTSVLVGHVDTMAGPAVFHGLGSLKKGNRIEVPRHDGRVAVFEVYGVEVLSTADFPGDRVYRDTGRAELRLITHGGCTTADGPDGPDGPDGSVVVFARLAATL